MTYGSLFTGIGGLDLGLDRAGFECRWQVEIDPYATKVLERHWPNVTRYGDITKLSGDELEPVDLLCGGFPCQDLSQAGKQAGITGSRSGLWFEFARLIGVVRPRYVLIENVPGLLVYDAMRRVIGELARLRYVGIWRSIRASEFGASHLRKRVFIVAHSIGTGQGSSGTWEPSGPRQTDRTGASGREVAYRERERSERWRDTGIMEGAASEEYREALQRQRNGHAVDDSGDDMAYSSQQPHNGTGISGQGRGGQPANGNRTLADAGNGQLQIAWRGPEGRDGPRPGSSSLGNSNNPRLEGWSDNAGEYAGQCATGTRGIGLEFAPGPSDPRWPYILRERPDLAPALESPLCRMVDGIPPSMDGDPMSNRTKRLGRLGNAVVPQIAEWIGHRIMEFERSYA